MSALQLKIGQIKDALQCIKFAIEVMSKHPDLKDSKAFIYLYYNYAILLETHCKYS